MNRFELTGINKDYIEHLDEPRLMQFYTLCCKIIVTEHPQNLPELEFIDAEVMDGGYMNGTSYLPFMIYYFNDVKTDTPRRVAVTHRINRKKSKRGLAKRRKLMKILSDDIKDYCISKFCCNKNQITCRNVSISRFYSRCRYKYLTFPPSSISATRYRSILECPRINSEDKDYFKSIYDTQLPNGRHSSKGNICKDNFIKVSDILYKERTWPCD